ncbi:unnamed protein product [Prorocentrum cordatum]|uniref:Galectin n=1 Tax=Prorocentrum cordatum TaxID=2364126 RepID=A0ABN9XWA3_9DINO|nr:unnamed protein product [Polarella glacialis]
MQMSVHGLGGSEAAALRAAEDSTACTIPTTPDWFSTVSGCNSISSFSYLRSGNCKSTEWKATLPSCMDGSPGTLIVAYGADTQGSSTDRMDILVDGGVVATIFNSHSCSTSQCQASVPWSPSNVELRVVAVSSTSAYYAHMVLWTMTFEEEPSPPTPSPTPSPTASPTPNPTASPTPNPTPSPTSSPTPGPTLSPTSSPTPSPTPSPTSLPPPSPPASPATSVSGTGDPHLVNVHGQRFDLYQPGVHSLIRIPKSLQKRNALLVRARASRLGAKCTDLYFTEINVTGTWARHLRPADRTWVAEDAASRRPRWHRFSQVSIKVVHGHTMLGTRYLNVFVRGLNSSKFQIGGLLGEDDHTVASTASANCKKSITF